MHSLHVILLLLSKIAYTKFSEGPIPVGHRLVLKEQDPSPWGANEVYRLYQEEGWYMNWYLLCYEDRIIDIRFDWEPTTDDMAIVNQKLNP